MPSHETITMRPFIDDYLNKLMNHSTLPKRKDAYTFICSFFDMQKKENRTTFLLINMKYGKHKYLYPSNQGQAVHQ